MAVARSLRRLGRGVVAVLSCLALQSLAACAELAASEAKKVAAASKTAPDVRSTIGSPFLQPAPQVLEATGTAVWDGRRTLQGVWAAHPGATSARRVRIFNEGSGTAVDGTLFKRDPTLTGPPVIVSSEAAEILGMQPGEEAELRIVAVEPAQRAEAKSGEADASSEP